MKKAINPIPQMGGQAILKKRGKKYFKLLAQKSVEARRAKRAAENSTKTKTVSRAKKSPTK